MKIRLLKDYAGDKAGKVIEVEGAAAALALINRGLGANAEGEEDSGTGVSPVAEEGAKKNGRKKSGAAAAVVAALILALFFAIALVPQSAHAQTLSVTATSAAIGSATASINGALTASNGPINGVTNTASLVVFYGGADGGQNFAAWSRYREFGSAITNNDTFSLILSNLTAGTIIHYNVRAQDALGEAWLAASKTLTTATTTAAVPDLAFREALRAGSFTNLTVGGWLIHNVASNHWRFIAGNTTNKLYLTSGP